MQLLRRPISSSDQIPDRFYISDEEREETDVFAGYEIEGETKTQLC